MSAIPSPSFLPPGFEASSKPWQIIDKVNLEHISEQQQYH